LWEHFLNAALSLPKQYALYGYNVDRRALYAVYQKMDPHVLYAGPIANGNAPSGNHHGNVSIEAVPIARARVLLPLILQRRWHFHRLSAKTSGDPAQRSAS
jgi:hypothetical protein